MGDASDLPFAYENDTLTVNLPAEKRTKLVDVIEIHLAQ
jgi:hypothetical protein